MIDLSANDIDTTPLTDFLFLFLVLQTRIELRTYSMNRRVDVTLTM